MKFPEYDGEGFLLNVVDQPTDCTLGCGACCEALDIHDTDGTLLKPSGIRCENLTEQNLCGVWGTPEQYAACQRFTCRRATRSVNRELHIFLGR